MGQRLTERTSAGVAYVGKYTKMPGLDCASTMRVAAVRDVMERLAAYEDTGLTPDQIIQHFDYTSANRDKLFQNIRQRMDKLVSEINE